MNLLFYGWFLIFLMECYLGRKKIRYIYYVKFNEEILLKSVDVIKYFVCIKYNMMFNILSI